MARAVRRHPSVLNMLGAVSINATVATPVQLATSPRYAVNDAESGQNACKLSFQAYSSKFVHRPCATAMVARQRTDGVRQQYLRVAALAQC